MRQFYYEGAPGTVLTGSEALKRQNPGFYFHDDEFAQVDWTQEPAEDLLTLYRRRAEQLRRDYEYLILAYSGGYDSTTILETFVYNKIPLDEILVVGAFKQDPASGSDANHNAEIHFNVYPTLKSIGLDSATKITIVDYTQWFDDPNNFPLLQRYGSSYIEHTGSWYSPHHLFWHDLKTFIGRGNDKRVGVIFGFDKPQFDYNETGDYCLTRFPDSLFTNYGNFQRQGNFERVCFYTSPESAVLMRKQLHVIRRFYRSNVVDRRVFDDAFFRGNYDQIVNTLIYNLRNPLMFVSPKSPTRILSLRDQFIKRVGIDEPIKKIYVEAVRKLRETTAPERVVYSRHYRLD